MEKQSDDIIEIVDFETKYRTAYRDLNVEWISAYFEMEETDYRMLENPEGYVLERGGFIKVALLNGEPVGVGAMVKMRDPEYDFEMAKMAVSPKAQGKKIGWLLAQSLIGKARELGARKIYLESNTVLKSAINLYYKLGFQEIEGRTTPYKRVNIQMELALNPTEQ